jgi:hypothetical protein
LLALLVSFDIKLPAIFGPEWRNARKRDENGCIKVLIGEAALRGRHLDFRFYLAKSTLLVFEWEANLGCLLPGAPIT